MDDIASRVGSADVEAARTDALTLFGFDVTPTACWPRFLTAWKAPAVANVSMTVV
jgi:hypothetical protein